MSMDSGAQGAAREGDLTASAEQRLKALGMELPAPPEPFGSYVEAVQTGNLLFLSGMLPTEGRSAKFVGRVGAELDVERGRSAARLAALNVLAVARKHLGSLDRGDGESCGSACRWLPWGMSAINRKWRTLLRNYCKAFLEKRRALAA